MATLPTGHGLPAVIHDPAGDLHGLPTYHWTTAPEGLATRRQLSAQGLRPGGHAPVAQIRRRGLVGFLYRIDLAKPKFRLTAAKLAAVWKATRSRYRCCDCLSELEYIPRQGEPCHGRCWTCAGYPEPEPEPVELACHGCGDTGQMVCPACDGEGGWGQVDCSMCGGEGLTDCAVCRPF